MFYASIKDKVIIGFYIEEFHGLDKCQSVLDSGGIKCDEELWQHLLTLGECKFVGTVEQREYTILDKDFFEKIVRPADTTPKPPTLEERITTLGEELTLEKLKGIQKDNTISQLGKELANVKLEVINMKGGN